MMSCAQNTSKSSHSGLWDPFPPERSDLRVLVVDDVKTNRQLLYYILEKEGFLPREASEGEEALKIFEEWHPHLILMDHLMPGMDGLEATRRIRDLPGGGETLIIIITANVRTENESASQEAGANGFIRKPFRKAKLVGEIEQQLLEKKSLSEKISREEPPSGGSV